MPINMKQGPTEMMTLYELGSEQELIRDLLNSLELILALESLSLRTWVSEISTTLLTVNSFSFAN